MEAEERKIVIFGGVLMRAIISVSDKTGVTDFAQGLSWLGFEIFSTGGKDNSFDAVNHLKSRQG